MWRKSHWEHCYTDYYSNWPSIVASTEHQFRDKAKYEGIWGIQQTESHSSDVQMDGLKTRSIQGQCGASKCVNFSGIYKLKKRTLS